MPDPIFPKFPTSFSPEDEDRIKQLEDQRKSLSQAYNVKFSPEAWAKTSAPEKFARGIAPSWLIAPARILTPGVEETTEFGFTPEQFQEKSLAIEQEYRELSRKQKVTELLPGIQADVLVAALAGKPITTLEDLKHTFPELQTDFNEQEINYLSRMTQALLQATPEQIASGEVFAYEPNQLPVTEEDIDALAKAGIKDPRFIHASVEFSKDLEGVTQALKDAYPSQTPDEEVKKALSAKLKAYFQQRNVELGITTGGDTKQAIIDQHTKIAEKAGTAMTLVGEDGQLVSARKRSDGTVYVGDELVGYADAKGNVVGFNLQGQPVTTPEEQELLVKDYLDALYVANQQAGLGLRNFFTTILPDTLLNIAEKAAPVIYIADEKAKEARLRQIQDVREDLKARYEKSQLEYNTWIKENPDLAPRPEWVSDPEKNPKSFINPGRIGYVIFSNAPLMVAALATTLATTVVSGGNIVLGSYAGAAVMTPSMTASIVDDAVESGANFEDATTLGTVVGLASGMVEIFPATVAMSIISPTVMRLFKQEFRKEAVTQVVKGLMARGIIGVGIKAATNMLKISATEILEENIQQIMQNAYVKVYNDNRGVFDGLLQTTIDTFWAVAPLSFMGGVTSYMDMKRNLPPKVQAQIEAIATPLKGTGLTEEHAEAVALAQVMETETGQAQVQQAVEKAVDTSPPSEAITRLTKESDSLNRDLEEMRTRLVKREKDLPLARNREETDIIQSDIDTMRESVSDIKAELRSTNARLRKVKKAVTPIPKVGKIIPEVGIPAEVAPVPEVTKTAWEMTVKERFDKADIIRQKAIEAQKRVDDLLNKTEELRKNKPVGWQEAREKANKEIFKIQDEMKAMADEITELQTPTAPKADTPEVSPVEPSPILQILARNVGIAAGEALVDKTPFAEGGRAEIPLITVQSVSAKIIANERLSVEETQFYNNNVDAVETLLEEEFKRLQTPDSLVPSIIDKILTSKRLTEEETQFYNDHSEIIENILKIDEFKGEATLRRLIPDLTYDPSVARPKLPDLDEELARFDTALTNNPDIKALIRPNKELKSLRDAARDTITSLRTDIEIALEEKAIPKKKLSKEEKKDRREFIADKEKQLREIGKKAGLRSRDLLAKGWGDLTIREQSQVTLSFVPDHSISSGVVDDLRDTALVFSSMEKETGLPFLHHLERMETIRTYCLRLQDEYFKRIVNVPRWRKIVRDNKKMAQVALIIDSRRPGSKTVVKPPVTEEELLMVEVANGIETVFKEWQPIVRFQRFIEAYEESSNVEAIHAKIPDAPIADIEAARNLMETQGEDALWRFLSDKEWGVYKSGYSPWRISQPNLELDEPSWSMVRGANYLMSRDSTQMPWEAQKGLLRTYDSYNFAMAMRYFLRREVQDLADTFKVSWDKWTDPNHVQGYIRKYLRAAQGFPDEDAHVMLRIMRKLQSWSHPNIFWHPFVGTRNVIQGAWSHPYRSELIKSLWKYNKLPADFRYQAEERRATVLDQSGRPLRNWMFQDEEINILGEVPDWVEKAFLPFKFVSKGFDFLAAQTAKIPTIAITDKISRSASYHASLVKAWDATEQYRIDQNAQKWFDNSGINSGYISREQQEHILGLFALKEDKVSWAISGLQDITGYRAAVIRIAEETTNRTLYLYDKAAAAGVHRGGGRTFSSLFTFSRSTIQMYGMQFARALSKDSTVSERLAATKNIVLLWLTGEILSSLLSFASGRRSKEYTVVNTLTWSFGGLGIGIARDTFDFLADIALASFGDDEDKERVTSRIPAEASRLGNVLLGFYSFTMDAIEAATDEQKGLDIRWFRQVRALFDENYTPEQKEKAERDTLQIVQKILMGADAPDPDIFERTMETLTKEEDRLGEVGVKGDFYTLGDFGSKVEASTKIIPEYLLTEEAGFSDLALFYLQSRDRWAELYTLPSEERPEWRKNHVEEEAMLLFWEKNDKSVFRIGSREWQESRALIKMWLDRYKIDRSMYGKWANWYLPIQIPSPTP